MDINNQDAEFLANLRKKSPTMTDNEARMFLKAFRDKQWKESLPYEKRIVTITYKAKVKDGTIVERTKTKNTSPLAPNRSLLKMVFSSSIPGFTIGRLNVNREHLIPGRHIIKNLPQHNTRGKKVRPLVRVVLNKYGVEMIKIGKSRELFDLRRKIKPEYKKTVLTR